jgi:hypothetical protein
LDCSAESRRGLAAFPTHREPSSVPHRNPLWPTSLPSQLTLWSLFMRRAIFLIASAMINVSTIPALASECLLNKEIGTLCTQWGVIRSRPAGAGGVAAVEPHRSLAVDSGEVRG